MISNDITISLNELFKYFDTANVSGFRRDTSRAFRHISIVTCILLNEVNNYVKERKEKEYRNAVFFLLYISSNTKHKRHVQ